MRISDWSSDVCSSDLRGGGRHALCHDLRNLLRADVLRDRRPPVQARTDRQQAARSRRRRASRWPRAAAGKLNMKKSILILLAGTTLLAGCNLAPKYERPAGAVPVALPQGGVYPAAPTDAPDVSRIGWRDFFRSEERRVGKEGVSKWTSGWSAYTYKNI